MSNSKKKKYSPPAVTAKKQPDKIVKPGNGKYYVPLFLIVLVSSISYLPALKNSFVWDDEGYLQLSTLIQSINLKQIFSTNVMGNYHPLTMLIYAIEYHFWGLKEQGYHAVNLIFHLLNVILVFYVVFLLSNKTGVALAASLLFGIHPVHVESVVWASELKDLMYVFFFLASYICYLKYLQHQQLKFYFLALLLFAFSLLSKAMAASLPVLLVLTDYFKDRKLNVKVWFEKAPFFALAILFGIIAIIAQKSAGATDVEFYSFPQRIVFASYGLINYLIKIVLPLNLSPYYQYPINSRDSLPVQYYIFPLLVLALIAYVIYSLRFSKKIVFGIGFFLVTVFLVLQLFPVGGAVMADRYCYLPSIGIFYLAGEGFILLWNKKTITKNSRFAFAILGSIIVILFSVKTYAQSGTWKNAFTLWSGVIDRNQNLAMAYYNRGLFFVEQQRDEEAINDFNKAIEIKPAYAEAYNNRGLRFENERRYEEAIGDYNKAIQFKPDFAKAYANRGNAFKMMNKNQDALHDFNKAIELNPTLAEVYSNRGTVFMTDSATYDKAFEDFKKAIELKPAYASAYSNRGLLYSYEKKYDQCLADYNKAIQLEPAFAKAWHNRGIIYNELKRYDEALNDFDQALAIDPSSVEVYNTRGTVLMNQKKYQEAFDTFNKAIELQPSFAPAIFNRGVSEFYLGKKENACSDFQHAIQLGYVQATSTYNSICH